MDAKAFKSLLPLVMLCGSPMMGQIPTKSASSQQQFLENNFRDAIYKLEESKTANQRILALSEVAKYAAMNGNMEDAGKYCEEFTMLAAKQSDGSIPWDSIHDIYIARGHVALSKKNMNEAKEMLMRAGNVQGSPRLRTFGPNMGLAKALLEAGEWDAVLEYIDQCRKFWTMGSVQLENWSNSLKRKEIPDFHGNLFY
ncbi:hypothetical protein [Mesoterricola silvestris]|uniref:hypothetical protein n=1 Tax=Mesoterricola silvestris TaxID=2927979 RepID=UPI0029309682|nr:hypothetical protein [Mesoterricola silvestris]